MSHPSANFTSTWVAAQANQNRSARSHPNHHHVQSTSPTSPNASQHDLSPTSPFRSDPGSAPSATQAQRTAEAREAFVAHLNNVGGSLDRELQLRARDVQSTAAAIQKQDSELQAQTRVARRENDKLEREVRDMRRKWDKEMAKLGMRDVLRQGDHGTHALENGSRDVGLDGRGGDSSRADAGVRDPWRIPEDGELRANGDGALDVDDDAWLDDFTKDLDKDLDVLEETIRRMEGTYESDEDARAEDAGRRNGSARKNPQSMLQDAVGTEAEAGNLSNGKQKENRT